MILSKIKKRLFKFFIMFFVYLSLSVGPVAGYEVIKMLESLTGDKERIMQELDEEGQETGEPEYPEKIK
jgi:hypothetical protein